MSALYAICSPDDTQIEGDIFYGTFEQFCNCFGGVYSENALYDAAYSMFGNDITIIKKPHLKLVK